MTYSEYFPEKIDYNFHRNRQTQVFIVFFLLDDLAFTLRGGGDNVLARMLWLCFLSPSPFLFVMLRIEPRP